MAANKLIQGYTQMLSRIKHRLQDNVKLEQAYEEAKQTAVHLGELTQDEAELLITYLKRDLNDAAHSLNESGKVLGDWLAFDWQLVEKRLWDLFSLAADKTRLQQLQFQQQLKHGPTYYAGEITGPGSLKCLNCDHVIHFYAVSEIPVCSNCQQSAFTR